MGCDIHAMAERRRSYRNEDGTELYGYWLNAGDPDISRDYEVFAVLAGVRNYIGVEPVAEPRGLPGARGWNKKSGEPDWEDYSAAPCSAFQAWYGHWHGDAHSESWVTLAELKAFDTEQEVEDPDVVVARDESGAVIAKAGWSSTGGEPVGRRRLFVWPGGDPDESNSWTRLVGFLEAIRAQHDLSDEGVRLVFFFDN